MTKLEELEQRVKDLKLTKQQVAEQTAIINAFLPVSERLKTTIKDKVNTNKMAIFESLVEGIKDKMDSKEIIEAIDNQTQALKDEDSKQIVNEVKKVFEQLQKLEKKTYFDEKEFNSIFQEGLQKVVNLVVSQNDVPLETTYQRNAAEGKVSKVIERYDGFILNHEWIYNKDNQLVKVKTTKNETS